MNYFNIRGLGIVGIAFAILSCGPSSPKAKVQPTQAKLEKPKFDGSGSTLSLTSDLTQSVSATRDFIGSLILWQNWVSSDQIKILLSESYDFKMNFELPMVQSYFAFKKLEKPLADLKAKLSALENEKLIYNKSNDSFIEQGFKQVSEKQESVFAAKGQELLDSPKTKATFEKLCEFSLLAYARSNLISNFEFTQRPKFNGICETYQVQLLKGINACDLVKIGEPNKNYFDCLWSDELWTTKKFKHLVVSIKSLGSLKPISPADLKVILASIRKLHKVNLEELQKILAFTYSDPLTLGKLDGKLLDVKSVLKKELAFSFGPIKFDSMGFQAEVNSLEELRPYFISGLLKNFKDKKLFYNDRLYNIHLIDSADLRRPGLYDLVFNNPTKTSVFDLMDTYPTAFGETFALVFPKQNELDDAQNQYSIASTEYQKQSNAYSAKIESYNGKRIHIAAAVKNLDKNAASVLMPNLRFSLEGNQTTSNLTLNFYRDWKSENIPFFSGILKPGKVEGKLVNDQFSNSFDSTGERVIHASVDEASGRIFVAWKLNDLKSEGFGSYQADEASLIQTDPELRKQELMQLQQKLDAEPGFNRLSEMELKGHIVEIEVYPRLDQRGIYVMNGGVVIKEQENILYRGTVTLSQDVIDITSM